MCAHCGVGNLPCFDLNSLENSLRITLKVSREFVESCLGFEWIWKFLQEPVKRSKDLGSTVFLHQLLKNDGCANVLMETKTNRVFEAIVYFRNCVIRIHKFVLKHCILRMQRRCAIVIRPSSLYATQVARGLWQQEAMSVIERLNGQSKAPTATSS